MPNLCNVKLIVAGSEPEVRRFMRAATHNRGRRGRKRAVFSLAVGGKLGGDRVADAPPELLDPWRDKPERRGRGVLRVVYGFQTAWAPPDEWIVAVATRFPALVFVLGWVEPNMDMAGSLIAGRDSTRRYELGARRKAAIYRKHHRRWDTWVRTGEVIEDDDNDLFADWDADVEVMEVVVARWDSLVRQRTRPDD